jgi:hypothetical protein
MAMKAQTLVLDVYYSDFGIKGFTAACVNIVKSWDGTLYAECNVLELCGPGRVVYTGDSKKPAYVHGQRLNCPAQFIQ